MRKIYLFAIAVILTVQLNAQLIVDSSQPAEDVIENTFLSNGIFVANVTFIGASEQIGTFNGANCNVGIGEGIVMASGDVAGAIGPNNTSSFSSGSYFSVSDPDLAILSGFPLNDASVIEFDFIATGDSLDFQFVFGSEEYPEFVNSSFNDIFGFFVSGPGISGPFLNNAANIAIVPGTDVAVAIDNVNDGEYSEFYIANGDGYEEPFMSDSTYIQCDGFTVVLHASIGQLQVGETYHIKLAIADASDSAYDSYVFLSGESFVQFCTEEVGFLPDLCLLSHLDAEFEYTGDCGMVQINNYSDINIEYTNCYIETGDGGILDACIPGLEYEYTQPGTYTLNLVYEVNEFHAQFELGQVVISSTPPLTPEIVQSNDLLTASNYNSEWQIQWYMDSEPIPGAVSESLIISESGTYSVAYTNSCGTISSTENVVFQGINDLEHSPVSIYPNPSDGVFTVTCTLPGVILSLYDISGKLAYRNSCVGQTYINQQFESGIYTLEVQTSSGELVTREKLVIQ